MRTLQTAAQRRSTLRQSRTLAADSPAVSAPTDEKSEPSARTLRLIEDVRKPFASYVSDFGALQVSRVQLAPKFMKAFAAWQSDTGASFVAFVRLFDSSIPTDSAGYRAHSVYQAADYLRRLAARGAQAEREEIPPSKRPATPLVALARLFATILPLVEDVDLLWQAFAREMHWTSGQAKRLQTLAAQQQPIMIQASRREPKRPAITLIHGAPEVRRTGTHG